MLLGIDPFGLLIEGGEGAHRGADDVHRVGIRGQGSHHLEDLFRHREVEAEGVAEAGELLAGRQFTVPQKVGHLFEAGAVGKFVDVVTAVDQFAFQAIDQSELAGADVDSTEPSVDGIFHVSSVIWLEAPVAARACADALASRSRAACIRAGMVSPN